ncbi:hypothetical protein NEOLEDRAFT_106656 [Neolentinus lepideus HHB14362 ss-1]|uniref:Uncharacterized protein n=1 Tax=Neolentinus lepideus HHB14362 ss-1 TaxID=1314782 RepID=A0A165U4R8_9AGAM|nr:hypothetical protein NEOLEDRAFT_106656 [Neolentinus lepideus HHB14362 ss-1]
MHVQWRLHRGEAGAVGGKHCVRSIGCGMPSGRRNRHRDGNGGIVEVMVTVIVEGAGIGGLIDRGWRRIENSVRNPRWVVTAASIYVTSRGWLGLDEGIMLCPVRETGGRRVVVERRMGGLEIVVDGVWERRLGYRFCVRGGVGVEVIGCLAGGDVEPRRGCWRPWCGKAGGMGVAGGINVAGGMDVARAGRCGSSDGWMVCCESRNIKEEGRKNQARVGGSDRERVNQGLVCPGKEIKIFIRCKMIVQVVRVVSASHCPAAAAPASGGRSVTSPRSNVAVVRSVYVCLQPPVPVPRFPFRLPLPVLCHPASHPVPRGPRFSSPDSPPPRPLRPNPVPTASHLRSLHRSRLPYCIPSRSARELVRPPGQSRRRQTCYRARPFPTRHVAPAPYRLTRTVTPGHTPDFCHSFIHIRPFHNILSQLD